MQKSKRVRALQELFERHARSEVKAWFNAYLKGAIQYRGLRTPLVRDLVHRWVLETADSGKLRPDIFKKIAYELLEQPYAEDKFAGILLLEEQVLPRHALVEEDFEKFAQLFQRAFLADWSTVDGFSVRVLSRIVESYSDHHSKHISQILESWASQDNLWQARAAAISLVRLAKNGEKNFEGFVSLALSICKKLVRRPERFAQTGAGWLLRELSIVEQKKVLRFLKQFATHMSSEGVRYACEKLPPELRSEMAELRKKPRKKG